MIKAVIFDLDGTLLDTIEDIADSCNMALSHFGMPEHSYDAVMAFVGNGIPRLIEKAVPGGRENENFDRVLQLMRETYSRNWHNKTKPYDGIMDLIRELKAHGIKVGINSNKPDPQVKELAQLFFSEAVGSEMALGDREDINRKPAPDLANKLMESFGVSKEETIYVGDSDVDIATARNAGIKCISVTWGFRSREFLKEHGADIFADTPKQILDIIL